MSLRAGAVPCERLVGQDRKGGDRDRHLDDDCADQSQKENPPGRCARPEAFLAFRRASGWTTWRAPKGVGPGWQLEPSGHGCAVDGRHLRTGGSHLIHCLNEAPQPNGTWVGWRLKLAHLIFPLKTRNLSREVTRGSVLSTGWRDHVVDNGRRMSLCTSLGSPLVSPDFGAYAALRVDLAQLLF